MSENVFNVGDIVMYPFYEKEYNNNSKTIAKVLRYFKNEKTDILLVTFLMVGNDDSKNGLFEYLKKKEDTMYVSPEYCRKPKVFESGEDLLEDVNNGIDFYSPSTGIYISRYNDEGAIAVYDVSIEKAEELIKEANKLGGEQWSALLGTGGYIYDACNEEKSLATPMSNLDKCNGLVVIKDWIPTKYFEI